MRAALRESPDGGKALYLKMVYRHISGWTSAEDPALAASAAAVKYAYEVDDDDGGGGGGGGRAWHTLLATSWDVV